MAAWLLPHGLAVVDSKTKSDEKCKNFVVVLKIRRGHGANFPKTNKLKYSGPGSSRCIYFYDCALNSLFKPALGLH